MNMTYEELMDSLRKNPALRLRKSELEKLEGAKNQKEHKYHAQPGYLDGIYFDSQAEMERYGELRILKIAKIIIGFKVHPKYKISSKKYYEADFEVTYPDGHKEVEDVKGVETQAFKLKEDLFRERYPDLILKIIK
jgi:hypothetical protein